MVYGKIHRMDRERLRGLYSNSYYYLSGGIDSGVCLIPPMPEDKTGLVAHFYKSHLPISQLQFYVDITNRASQVVKQEQWRWRISRRLGEMEIRVVPFQELLFLGNTPIGISEQIAEKRCSGPYETHFVEPFLAISNALNERLGVRGIQIITFNAQYTGKDGALFVTDLCDSIMNLQVVDN